MPVSQTSRGAIGAGRICPQNEYAIGYRLKMHNQVSEKLQEELQNVNFLITVYFSTQVGATWHDDQGEAA